MSNAIKRSLRRAASPAVVTTAERPAADSAGLMNGLFSDQPPPRTTASAEYIVGEIKRHKKGAVLALAALIGAVVAIAYFSAGRSAAVIDSIAVMPLVSTGGDASAEYLSDGITENIINSLSRLSALQVMARATVFRYKGQEVDPQKIGRDLRVAAVVTGRVTQRGDALSIQVELVDVSTGRQVWGELKVDPAWDGLRSDPRFQDLLRRIGAVCEMNNQRWPRSSPTWSGEFTVELRKLLQVDSDGVSTGP